MNTFILTLLIILMTFSKSYSQDFWEKTNGLDSITIYSLAINSNGDIFAGADTSYGVFRSTDNGINWTNLELMNLKTTGIVIKPSEEILVTTLDHFLGGGVFRSTDNGDSWTNMGFTGAATSIAINSSGDIFVGTFNIGVFRSTDNGVSWVQIIQGLTELQMLSLAIDSSGSIFAGTYLGGVFRSTDNGENWVQINSSITNNQILSLATNSNGDIFAGTHGGGVFRSIDNGVNWVPINQGLAGESLYIFSLAVNSGGNIFAGTAGGIFRSTDNGDDWVQINQGLTNDDVHSLAINSNDDVFAGTEDGIFRSLYSTTSIDATVTKIISSFKLYQNYPNPFNPSTTIKFAITNESNVNLSIYNALGELVSTLVNEQLKTGYHEYEFNASNLASGVYLYRIIAGDFVETKKMILLR